MTRYPYRPSLSYDDRSRPVMVDEALRFVCPTCNARPDVTCVKVVNGVRPTTPLGRLKLAEAGRPLRNRIVHDQRRVRAFAARMTYRPPVVRAHAEVLAAHRALVQFDHTEWLRLREWLVANAELFGVARIGGTQ